MPWEPATIVAASDETPTAKTFRLTLTHPVTHLAGQHYILKLTAPDGYSAQRSYSIASPPDGSTEFDLTIERLPDGEVSTFMYDEAAVGDELEVRGPIGGFFVWNADVPVLLIGGGSGLVPLMAMLRLARRRAATQLVRLLVSVREPGQLYYADELPGPETSVIYTRASPSGDPRPVGRLVAEDIQPILAPDALVFICGSSPFADAATECVSSLGVPLDRIRIERFGATG